MAGESMFKEDAEKLADQITDENPMVDILDIRVDTDFGGYVIVAYDRGTDEEFTIDSYESWVDRRPTTDASRYPGLIVKVKERHGRKTGVVAGEWAEVDPDDWPDDICDAVEDRKVPGELLTDLEPSVADTDVVEPGRGSPADYGFDGTYLTMVSSRGARVWQRIAKLANFTTEDLSDQVHEWRSLGFALSPEPQAPFIEPGEEWDEHDILEEVRDRLFDLSERGYSAILVDGPTSATAYAWLLAGIMGLRVITGYTRRSTGERAAFSGLGYSELLHFREVEDYF